MFFFYNIKSEFCFKKIKTFGTIPAKSINFFSKKNIFKIPKKRNQLSIDQSKSYKKKIFHEEKTKRNCFTREIPLNYNIFLISGIGLMETLQLSYIKLKNSSIICGTEGCSNVLNSPFSDFFGFPISFFGLFIYGVIFMLFVKKIFFEKNYILENKLKIFFFDIIILFYGIASTFFSINLEEILRTKCQWCLLSIIFTNVILLASSFQQNIIKSNINLTHIICINFLFLIIYSIDFIEMYFFFFS